jgi:hypothetical protein
MTDSLPESKKAKPSGCGCLSPMLLLLGFFFLKNFTFTWSFDPTGEQLSLLEQNTQQVRSQFQAKECDPLYQQLFGTNASDESDSQVKSDFDQLCTQMGDEYQNFKSVELTGASCETVTTFIEPTQTTQCVLSSRVTLADNRLLLEEVIWLFNGEIYQILDMSWSNPQLE